MITIREADKKDDVVIATHLRSITLELGSSEADIRQDWLEQILLFIERARDELSYKGFVAEVNGKAVGSAGCQLLELYPMVSNAYQKGYIWGVYVEAAYRRRGVATSLMGRASQHLREIGCTRAVLHASDTGKKLYAGLGYEDSNEMVLTL